MGKYKAGSTVKYGTGEYDSQSHKGRGKSQKLLPPAVGDGYNRPTPNSGSAPARDGVEGHAGKKRGYQIDAHTGLHHGPRGQALGHADDLHQDYSTQLYSEGRALAGERNNPGFVADGGHGDKHRAQHHPAPSQTPDKFHKPSDDGAHGYRYGSSQKKGFLRMSGHSKAHQVGRR